MSVNVVDANTEDTVDSVKAVVEEGDKGQQNVVVDNCCCNDVVADIFHYFHNVHRNDVAVVVDSYCQNNVVSLGYRMDLKQGDGMRTEVVGNILFFYRNNRHLNEMNNDGFAVDDDGDFGCNDADCGGNHCCLDVETGHHHK